MVCLLQEIVLTKYIDKLLQSFSPSEILFQKNNKKKIEKDFGNSYCSFMLDDWVFSSEYANELLTKKFGTKSLKGFGISDLSEAVIAAGVALHYLKETEHIKQIIF